MKNNSTSKILSLTISALLLASCASPQTDPTSAEIPKAAKPQVPSSLMTRELLPSSFQKRIEQVFSTSEKKQTPK